ncbi:hypothetical protein [Novosphingobium sp. BW1]|uniref:hypothetical protein n=1 Tax=Novosphingobium sp. BW1 TaxID=2592621 RepID=UPI0011DEAAE3|nr:hypothetical protein [Novosphingobium sp. BW1]TYC78767.1 hypothetical protein FMM79_20690 [Novosphingobium sp. BW1]
MDAKPITADGPREGIGYVLPYTQWTITVAWRLDYCPDPKDPNAHDGKDAQLAVKVEAVAGSADDGDLSFVINPQDLQTLTSVTTFGAKWLDGRNMLSSINATVEDRSAQIVGNLVKTAVKIIPLAAGVPAPPGGARSATLMCTDGARQALADAATAKAALKVRTGALDAATKVLGAVQKKVAAMGDAVDDPTKAALSAALDNAVAAQAAQTEADGALTEALDAITYKRVVRWPDGGNVFSGGPIVVDRDKLESWIPGLKGQSIPKSAVYLQIERVGSFGRAPEHLDLRPLPPNGKRVRDPANPVVATPGSDPYKPPAASSRGLRYRMPAAGTLVACSESPCGADAPSTLATFPGQVVQLGYVNVLPFRSRAFGNNSMSAEFNPDGSLKSVGYEQKSASLEGATGAVADAADQLAGALDPTARLTQGNAYLEALKKRRDDLQALAAPKDDPVADETTSLGAETTLLNARIARLKAEIAYEELRASQGK